MQLTLGVHNELIVDLFAGGGGASTGIEAATGRRVDVAVNHDPIALGMHRINHPETEHFVADVFEVDPREVTRGRPVGLLWASPDCTHHSRAKGSAPLRDDSHRRRALAWIVKRWAGQVRPRVIVLENVGEFRDWCRLVGDRGAMRPCPKTKGHRYRRFVRSLERMGYRVEWRILDAHEYGTPTIRSRLYMVARRDGNPIVWPDPSHGPGRLAYLSSADCIDWSIPACSIFAGPEEARRWSKETGRHRPKRPIVDKSLRRIARGVVRYVIESEPFIAPIAPDPRPEGDRLVAAFLAKHYTGVTGIPLTEPLGTITTTDHHALVLAFLVSYYGTMQDADIRDPMDTITTKDRHALVLATVAGKPYRIEDIATRMLQPRELYRAQGFPDSYIIDRGRDESGRAFVINKTQSTHMVGNSVCPPVAASIVQSNVPELCIRAPRQRRTA